MSQENQATNSATSGSLPVKRKRGRPRKDERSIDGTPGSDTVKRNRSRKIELAPTVTNAMVGQVVSGVLDGKFDAGYLLTVRVGGSNTILRGVVFEPGLSAPVSGANDVAPHIKMLKRNENPHPVVPLQTQMHGSNHQSQQQQTVKPSPRNVDPIPLNVSTPVNQVPRTATHVLSSQLHIKPIALAEVQNDTNHVPQAAASQTMQLGGVRDKSSGNSFDGGRLGELNEVIQVPCKATESLIENKKPSDVSTKVEADHLSKVVLCNNDQTPLNPSDQIAQPGLQIESAVATQSSQTSTLEHNGPAKPAEVVQENEIVSLSKCLEDVGDASKLERNTDSSVEIVLPSKTIDQVSQAGNEVVKSEDKPNQQNNDAFKDQEVEPKHIILTVAPEVMASSPIEMLQDVPPTQKCDPLSDTEFKFEMLQEVPPTQKCDPLSDTEFKFEMLQEVPPTHKCDSLSDTEFKFEMLQEVPSTLKCGPLSDTGLKFHLEIPKTDEASYSNEAQAIKSAKVAESDPQPESGTNQEVEMLQVEAIPAKPNQSEDEQGSLSRDMPESLTHESTSPLPESLTYESTFPANLDDYFPQDVPESRTLESTLPTKVDAPESRTVESLLLAKEDDCSLQDTATLLQSLTNPEESNSYTYFL